MSHFVYTHQNANRTTYTHTHTITHPRTHEHAPNSELRPAPERAIPAQSARPLHSGRFSLGHHSLMGSEKHARTRRELTSVSCSMSPTLFFKVSSSAFRAACAESDVNTLTVLSWSPTSPMLLCRCWIWSTCARLSTSGIIRAFSRAIQCRFALL